MTKLFFTRPFFMALLFCLITCAAPVRFFQTGFIQTTSSQSISDDELASVRRMDSADRNARGGFLPMADSENPHPGIIYFTNRPFPESPHHFLPIANSHT